MEGKKTHSRAILLFGAPCSGKTTFGEQFAKHFKLAFINLDELKNKYNLTREQMLMVLEQVTKTKQTIVVEGGLDKEKEREEIRSLLIAAEYEPKLAWVQTDIITIRNRLKNQLKSVSKAKEVYDKAIAAMEAPTEEENPIILSGKHTFETQLRHTISGLAQ